MRNFPICRLLILSMLPLTVSLSAADQSEHSVVFNEKENSLRVELNGAFFTEYLFNGEDRYFPLFYPVHGPGGIPMTRNYPLEVVEGEDTDHIHHQSLWFAHSEINGHSFWAVQQNKGREPGNTIHRRFKEIEGGVDRGHFIAENDYVAADGTLVMTDTRTVRFRAPADLMAPRIIDITIAFHASNGEVVFGDQKDAGMAIRVASNLQVARRTEKGSETVPGTGNLLNSEGITGEETWGKRARWIDSYGKIGGETVGIAVFDHPANPRHPTYWHSRSYGLVAANVFGKRHFETLEDPKAGQLVIPSGETVTFRWQFVFHRDDPTKIGIENLYEDFARE